LNSARGGTVVDRGGKSHSGKVELSGNDRVVIKPDGAAATPVTLPFADVAKIWMPDAPMSPIDQTSGQSPASTTQATTSLPMPWRHCDIGDLLKPGDAAEKDGTFSLRSAGWGVWGGTDSCHFAYQTSVEDCDIIARVAVAPSAEHSFLAGVMIRQDLAPSAAEASVVLHPDGVPHLNCRPIDPGRKTVKPAPQDSHAWIRLIRAGDTFGGFFSADGQSWLPLGTVITKMTGTVYVGMVCSAIANQDLVTATFDHVTVRSEPNGPGRGFTLTDGSIIAATTLSAFDGKTLQYADGSGASHSVPIESVANVFNAPLPADMRAKLSTAKSGLWMSNGDVMEANVKELRGGQVAVESVLLGLQRVEFSNVAAVVLRPAMIDHGSFSVYQNDRSIYRCKRVTLGEGNLTAESATLGTITIKATDLMGVIADAP
jgi:hypothetical protein